MKDLNRIHGGGGGLEDVTAGAGGHPGRARLARPRHQRRPRGRGRGHHAGLSHHVAAVPPQPPPRPRPAPVPEADHGAAVGAEADGGAVAVSGLGAERVLLQHAARDIMVTRGGGGGHLRCRRCWPGRSRWGLGWTRRSCGDWCRRPRI